MIILGLIQTGGSGGGGGLSLGTASDEAHRGDHGSSAYNDAEWLKGSGTASVNAGVLTLDFANGANIDHQLTADITSITVSNLSADRWGIVNLTQDATAGWQVSATQDVLAGALADLASITATTGKGKLTVHNDGSATVLYVSDIT